MCSCHSILECCVTFSGVKLSIGSLVLFQGRVGGGTQNKIENRGVHAMCLKI